MADKTVAFRPFPGQSFSLRGSDADAGIVGELERSGGLYQRDLAAVLRHWLPSDAVAVDGGAHIGVISVLLAALCPAGHVYAFEPVPEIYAHLEHNIAANGFTNVTVERQALYREDGEIALTFDEAYPGGSHIGKDGKCRVATARLDSWAHTRGIERLDLLKLDVEGAEPAVLEGAEETLRRFRPVTVVECNPVALPRLNGTGYRELLHRLRALFPVVALIGTGGSILPLAGDRHLELALTHHGVVDLIGLHGLRGAERRLAQGRAATHLARLLAAHNRLRPPDNNFVVDPGGITLRPRPAELTSRVAEMLSVPVKVRNGTRTWLSSQFRYHPVHLSYRWFDEQGNVSVAEGHRTTLPEPLAPGASVQVDATVEVPPAPGRYELCFTMVQEHFAWLDDIDEVCTARIPVTVDAAPA